MLFSGESNEASQRKTRLINSSAADTVYSTSGGKLLPDKHISLGSSLKYVLSQFRHCVSNEKVRQIECRLEISTALITKLCLTNIRKNSKACTGLSCSNFDINLETLSDTGSIHHNMAYVTKILVLMKRKELQLIIATMLTRNTPKSLQVLLSITESRK